MRRLVKLSAKKNFLPSSICSSFNNYYTNIRILDKTATTTPEPVDVPVLSGKTFTEDEVTQRILNKLKQYNQLTEDVAIDVDLDASQRAAQEEANKRTYRREYDLLWEDEREPQYFKNSVQGKKIADIPCIFDMVPQLADRISPVITKAELEELLKKPKDVYNYMLVDVRSAFRALDYMIPGAVNIPFTDIKEGAVGLKAEAFNKRYGAPLPEAFCNIICYSDSPAESEAACMILQEMGFQNTLNYRGGCPEWFGNEFKILWRRKKLHKITGERKANMLRLKEKSKDKLSNSNKEE